MPEDSLRFFVRHEMALDLVCRADFSCKLNCRVSPGDLEGSWGPGRGRDRAGTDHRPGGRGRFRAGIGLGNFTTPRFEPLMNGQAHIMPCTRPLLWMQPEPAHLFQQHV